MIHIFGCDFSGPQARREVNHRAEIEENLIWTTNHIRLSGSPLKVSSPSWAILHRPSPSGTYLDLRVCLLNSPLWTQLHACFYYLHGKAKEEHEKVREKGACWRHPAQEEETRAWQKACLHPLFSHLSLLPLSFLKSPPLCSPCVLLWLFCRPTK